MLRVVCMAVLILINYILQSTVFQSIAILGVKPDTSLIFIVSYGMLRGDVEGAIFGFCAGLAHDLFGGYFIGLHTMLGMLMGYFSGKPFKNFFNENYFMPFFMVVIASVCYQFIIYCCIFLFTGMIELSFYARAVIVPKTIYTASVAIPYFSLIHVVNARIKRYEKNRRSLFKTE